jgi:hypothetical protein
MSFIHMKAFVSEGEQYGILCRCDWAFYADDAAFVFLSRAELIEGSTFITKEFARFGLTVHLGTKEPTRVTANTEALHIPDRGTTPDSTATAGYDVLDNSRFISFCDSFRYLGTQITPNLDETFEINTLIRESRSRGKPSSIA